MTTSIDAQDAIVIVIEDNPDNLMLVMDMLRDIPVKYCNSRASGRQFFKFMDGRTDLKIDLILLDIQIPHEDGYVILSQIRQLPQFSGTKVVAVTANALPQDVERARAAGFDGFLGKPLRLARFPDQIQRILDGEVVWEAR